jgi:hypothetical protein
MKKTKTYERKLTQNCSQCSSTFTLRETHLRITNKKGAKFYCADNCVSKWEELLNKDYREKVLGQELETENKENNNHGSH